MFFDHSGVVGCHPGNVELGLGGFWSFVGFAGQFI
jgi:hypothetical protein